MKANLKILVVDDDKEIRFTTRHALETAGYEVWEAENGAEALRLAAQLKPDLMLLDISMPVMDGLEVCRRIKSDPELASIFVVIVSGSRIDIESRVQGLETGADGYLIRPISNRELVARVKSMLRIKAAEDAAREKEAQLSDLIANNTDGMVVVDESGRGLFANPAACELLNLSSDDLAGQEIGLPLDSGEFTEITLHRPGQKERIVEFRARRIEWHGQPAWLASLRDITWRKEMQSELETLRLFHTGLIETMGEGIVVEDLDGCFSFVNPAAAAMLGYTPQEMLGKHIREVMPPDQIQKVQEINRQRAQGIASRYELTLLRKDGSLLPVQVSGSPRYQDGKYVGNLAVFIDISQIKETHARLAEKEKFLSAILQTAQDGFWMVNLEGRFIEVNQAYCDISGYSRAEILELSVWDIDVDENAAETRQRMARILTNGSDLFETCHRRKDGSLIEVEISITYLEIGAGQLACFCRDITECKRTERLREEYEARLEADVEERTRQLHETQEQLLCQQRLAVMGQLAGGVGHELRNPLAVINNAVYYLQITQPDAGEKIKEYLGIIEKEVRTAERIIADLLDFARAKSVEPEPVQVADLIQSVLSRYPVHATVNVSQAIPVSLPKIYADRLQIEQVLGNLVVNACQAMPQGGSLTISAVSYGKEICIAVEDSGSGISPENLPKMFEPLFTTKPKGIGLGLAVSKKLVEANGGRIELQSQAGEGAVFSVFLPTWEEAER
jgi:PAS domain S-box-containing protein